MGLSILVEYENKKILVDVGASELFAKNMEQLGINIRDIDYAALSHAPYDHANGMPRFMKEELGNKLEQLKVGLNMNF